MKALVYLQLSQLRNALGRRSEVRRGSCGLRAALPCCVSKNRGAPGAGFRISLDRRTRVQGVVEAMILVL